MDLRGRLAAMSPAQRAAFLASLDREELRQVELLTEGLLEFIPRVSPQLSAPTHLQPLVDLFERCETEQVRETVSTPPQFGKTKTALHALVQMIRRDPSKRHAYISYAADRSEAMSREAMDIVRNDGVKVSGSLKIWRTGKGGGVVWTGVGGPLTGFGVNGCMIVDDPTKNRAEAESSLYRERTDQWFRDVALTRLHPGASCIVIATRWHVDDLPGRLSKRGWASLNLPAINQSGESLWPEKRPLEWLASVRAEVGEYTWASLYQGEPRPRGGALFGDAHLYNNIPQAIGFRTSIGVDLAYSKKTHADYSVAVVLQKIQPDPSVLPVFYVLDVRRQQVKAPEFKQTLRAVRATHPGAPMRWYAAGAENGVGDFIKVRDGELDGIPIEVLPAKGDKFQRAQPVAAAWNAGRILVPEKAPWVPAFLSELASFTGVNDAHDDQVDALGTAYDLLGSTSAVDRFRALSTW